MFLLESDSVRRAASFGAAFTLALALAIAVGSIGGCESAPRTDDSAASASASPATPGAAAARSSETATPLRSTLTPPTLTRVVSNDGNFLVIYRTRPEPIPVGDRFAIEATVHDLRRNEALVRDAELFVDAAMPHHRHGMNVVPTVRLQNDGSFVTSGMLFHMPGRWEIYFDITRGLETERAQCEVWVE